MGVQEAPYKEGRKGIRAEYFPPEFSNHQHLIQIVDYSKENPELMLSFSLQRFLKENGYRIVKVKQ